MRILRTPFITLFLCAGLAACTSEQSDDAANAPTGAQDNAATTALTATPEVTILVPQLADHPTGAYLSLSEPSVRSQTGERTISISMATVQQVAGFQFRLSGGVPVACAGGRAAAVGFNVVTSEDTNIVLGHFDPNTITPVASGEGVLTQLTFRPDPSSTEVCLTEPVLSDAEGNSIEVVLGDCISLE